MRASAVSTAVADRAVDVHQRVGHVAARLVDHVVDVQAGAAPWRWRSGPACWARWRWRSPADRRDSRAMRHVREIDRVDDVAVLQVVAQLVDHHDGAVVLGLARATRPGAAAPPPAGGCSDLGARESRTRSQPSLPLSSAASTAASSTTPSREKLSSTAPARIEREVRLVAPGGACRRPAARAASRSCAFFSTSLTLPALLDLRRQAPGRVDGDLRVVARARSCRA